MEKNLEMRKHPVIARKTFSPVTTEDEEFVINANRKMKNRSANDVAQLKKAKLVNVNNLISSANINGKFLTFKNLLH